MFYFREHRWLMQNGRSRFEALINSDARTRDDVFWQLEMYFMAAGAIWRRVSESKRPLIDILVSSFRAPQRSWQDLGALNYWNLPEDPYMEMKTEDRGGFLDVYYRPRGSGAAESTAVFGCCWRVTGRDGGFFTVEMAGLANGQQFFRPPVEDMVLVDGAIERAEPDVEFYKKHAEFYLVENIPFGVVTVHVPRNARDVEAYALGRARELIGVNEPEHIEVLDPSRWKSENLHGDMIVHLHFHGFYDR